MENKLEYDEWTQNKFTKEMRQRFETEARSAFERLLKTCAASEDQAVKGCLERYMTALTLVRTLTGKLDYSFLAITGEKNGNAA